MGQMINEFDDPTPEQLHEFPLESEIWDESVDIEGAKQTLKDALPPAGMYQTIPSLTIQKKKWDDGRRTATLFGTIENAKDPSITAKIRFRVSPDRRDKEDGKPDIQSRLFANGVTAYKAIHETDPQSDEDVIQYLATFPLKLRTMRGDTDLVVLVIQPVK